MAKTEVASDATKNSVDLMAEEANLDIREPRVYEVGYWLVPDIKEEELDVEIDTVRKIITDQGGLPISEGRAELKDIAYPMDVIINNERNTFTKGYFGWIKFDVSPEKLAAIKTGFSDAKNIIRSLIVSTVREDTMIGKKLAPKLKGEDDSKKPTAKPTYVPKTEEPAEPINEETLDKQIDDLVVEE